MYLLLCLLLTIHMALNWSQNSGKRTCNNGWFGPNCQYKCRCSSNTCRCTDGDCASGWFGPQCQYVDLLHMNYTQMRNWLNDGNASTCNPDQSLTVTVNMSSEFPFTWLRLQVNQSSLLKEFQVNFTDKKSERIIPCKNLRSAIVNEKTLDIHCDMDELVQFVILEGESVQSLCSLYISGGRNVALHQNNIQSSTTSNRNSDLSASWNAVDGNHTQGSCISTIAGADQSPTWKLTFSSAHTINRYKVYNSKTSQYQLQGFNLRSFTKDLQMVFNYTDNEPKVLPVYEITSTLMTLPIYIVDIKAKQTKNTVLSMCEVELYGDSFCPPSMYGRDCEHKCNCAVRDESCFVSTGGCPSGCAAGYHGENCLQPCGLGKYGDGCRSVCSQYCVVTNNNKSSCFHTNGSCVLGCFSGYEVPKCENLSNVTDEDIISIDAIVIPLVLIVILVMFVFMGIVLWTRFTSFSNKQFSNEGNSDGNQVSKQHHNEQVEHKVVQHINSNTKNKQKQYSAVNQVTTSTESVQNPICSRTGILKTNVQNNTTSVMSSTSISIRELPHFLASNDKVFFQQQFNSIPANINATTNVGLNEENKHKNRYKNICAYDHSRVLLKTCNVKKWGDYINASYIDGYKGMKTFIASQGPTKSTLKDFVRMLLEQDVEIVVMLTNLAENGKTKCERYWPEDDVIKAGDIKVKLTTTQVFTDYTIRRLQLLRDGAYVHELTQFHFTAWPDKDVPTTAWSLVDFEQRLASVSTDKPIVVHCSAGVGRTGTFIALCNVIMEAIDTGYIDFFTAVEKLRHDRSFMVQTSDQYKFLHEAVMIAVVCMGTTIVSSDITERIEALEHRTESGQSKLDQEFKALCDICDDDISAYVGSDGEQSCSTYENTQTLSNKLKDRFQNVLAREDCRVILMGDSDEGLGDDINAVFIPSFSRKNQHILTQIPLPATVNDFLRMVTQYKVTLVVAFELEVVNADSIGEYFPWNENDEMSTPYFTIKAQQTSSFDLWNKQKLVLRKNSSLGTTETGGTSSSVKNHRLTHITYKGLLTNQTPSNLLALMKEVRSCSPMGDGRVVYMCRNGAEYSGLVCVLSVLLDRLDNDLRLTVPLVVGAVKAVRPQVIPTVRQYRLLYQVLQLYNDSNNVYNNFDA